MTIAATSGRALIRFPLSSLETGKPVLLLDWDADITYLNHRISDNAVWGSALQEGQTFPLQLHTGE